MIRRCCSRVCGRQSSDHDSLLLDGSSSAVDLQRRTASASVGAVQGLRIIGTLRQQCDRLVDPLEQALVLTPNAMGDGGAALHSLLANLDELELMLHSVAAAAGQGCDGSPWHVTISCFACDGMDKVPHDLRPGHLVLSQAGLAFEDAEALMDSFCGDDKVTSLLSGGATISWSDVLSVTVREPEVGKSAGCESLLHEADVMLKRSVGQVRFQFAGAHHASALENLWRQHSRKGGGVGTSTCSTAESSDGDDTGRLTGTFVEDVRRHEGSLPCKMGLLVEGVMRGEGVSLSRIREALLRIDEGSLIMDMWKGQRGASEMESFSAPWESFGEGLWRPLCLRIPLEYSLPGVPKTTRMRLIYFLNRLDGGNPSGPEDAPFVFKAVSQCFDVPCGTKFAIQCDCHFSVGGDGDVAYKWMWGIRWLERNMMSGMFDRVSRAESVVSCKSFAQSIQESVALPA